MDRDPDAQELLDRFHVNAADVPVLICRGEAVLRNPSNQQIAACLGFNDAIDQTHVSDLLIVGAGAGGAGGRGVWRVRSLDVLVLESNSPGRQAGSSSRIENYLGFPTGISGLELTGRVGAGPEVRRAHHDRERRHEVDLRSAAVRRAAGRRSARGCAR